MANLIPVEIRRREALVRLAALWGAVAVVAIGATVFLLMDSNSRVAQASERLAAARSDYEDLEAQIQATRRLVHQRDQLMRKQMAIETLRRDQRSIGALRDLAAMSGSAIWFQHVSLSEQTPKKTDRPKGKGFRPPAPSRATARAHTAKPVTVMVTGFALSQQELAEFLSRVAAHERFAGVSLRWSSRTPFLEGEAVKFVVSGAYR